MELESAMQKPRELQGVLAAFLSQRGQCLGEVMENLGALLFEGVSKALFVAEGLEIFVWSGGRGRRGREGMGLVSAGV